MRFRRYAILIAASAAVIAVAAGFRFTDATLMPPQGVVGQQYFHKVDVEDGCKGKVVTVGPGNLPPGLQLVGSQNDLSDGSDWRIEGTPTQAGSYGFGLTANDICKSPPTYRDLTIVINPKLTITTPAPSPIVVNAPFSLQLVATGTSSAAWSVAVGSLPPGISLSSSGLLSGTPTTVGAWTFTVLAKDGNRQDTNSFTLTVLEQLVASAGTLQRAEVGRPFAYRPSARGGLTPYAWSLAGGALPTGLTLDPATGAIRGTPLAAGAFPVQLHLKDAAGLTANLAVALSVARKLAITSTALRTGVEGRRYSAPIAKVGGVGPFVYRVVGGRLPLGLRLDSVTGRISGIPTRDGRFSFTVRVRDSLGVISTKPLRLTVRPA
jgi:large repetitive protein